MSDLAPFYDLIVANPAYQLSGATVLLCVLSLVVAGALAAYLTPQANEAVVDLSPQASALLLLTIIVGGASLRFWQLDFGLPNLFHPDEIPKLNAIEGMRSNGDLNPRYFLHPSLLLYLTHFTDRLRGWLGFSSGSREQIILAGRIVSAVAGTISLGLTYKIGEQLCNRRIGLLSAALLACFPLHVVCSRYVKEDSLLTCMSLLTALVVLTAIEKRRPWSLVLGGFCAGLTASSKYTGALSFAFVAGAPFVSALLFKEERSFSRYVRWILPLCAAALLAILGFLAATPYALLDSVAFLRGFNFERGHMSRGHMLTISAWSQFWMYHVRRSLLPGATPLPMILALMALGWGAVRKQRIVAVLAVSILLFYLPSEWVKAKPEPQPDRYVMPCLPWIALLAAWMIWQLRPILRRSFPVLVAVVLLIPMTQSTLITEHIPQDTRFAMDAWIRANVPPGSTIAMDYPAYTPPLHDAPFVVTYLNTEDILERIRMGSLKEGRFQYLVLSSFFVDRFFAPIKDIGHLRDLFRTIEKKSVLLHEERSPWKYGFHNPGLKIYQLP